MSTAIKSSGKETERNLIRRRQWRRHFAHSSDYLCLVEGGKFVSQVFAVRERMLILITFDCLIFIDRISGHYFRSSDFFSDEIIRRIFGCFKFPVCFFFYHFCFFFNVLMSNVNKVSEFCVVDWIPLTVTCLMGCIESRLRNMTSSTFLSFLPSLFNFFLFSSSSISTSSNKKK